MPTPKDQSGKSGSGQNTDENSDRRRQSSLDLGIIDDRRLSYAASRVVSKALKNVTKPAQSHTHISFRDSGEGEEYIAPEPVMVSDGDPNEIIPDNDEVKAQDEMVPNLEKEGGKNSLENGGPANPVTFLVDEQSERKYITKEIGGLARPSVGVSFAAAGKILIEDDDDDPDQPDNEPNEESEGPNTTLLMHPQQFLTINRDISEANSETNVIVPIHAIPEESLATIAASPSFAERHTIPVDSVLPGGLEIHSDRSLSRINIITVKQVPGQDIPMPVASEAIVKYDGPPAGEECLIDEMAAAVAAQALGFPSIAVFQDISSQFSAAVAATTNQTGRNGRSTCSDLTKNRAGASFPNQNTLPPEVRDHVLEVLADIKAQLDTVKHQLREQGVIKEA